MNEDELKIGDSVDKVSGYGFPGRIVSIFQTTRQETRYVVEMEKYGILHIFNRQQLRRARL